LTTDLERLRAAARSLQPVQPPAGVWAAIAGQIRPGRRVRMRWLGLAAAVVTIAATYAVLRHDTSMRGDAGAGNAAASASVQTIQQKLEQADRLYAESIAQLEAVARQRESLLDPEVAEALRRSQAALDRAIDESRTALQREPANAAARASLFGALRQKVALLQDAIAIDGAMPRSGAVESGPGRKTS
jgi:hypothetical protein